MSPGPSATTSADVAVVGAGPAGLSAALLAARAGHRVVVLEASDQVGGMAGSFEVAGQRVDFGSHRLHPSIAPDLRALLEDLLGDDLQVRPRHGRIRLQGRWLPFPFGPLDAVRRLPPGFAARVGCDAVLAPFRREHDDTFAEVVRAGLGPAIAEGFYGPYARKLWDTPAEQLAGELARRRVSAQGPLDLVKKAVRRGEHPGRTFLYPRRGFGQISEVLADAASAAGAEIQLGAAVTGIEPGPDRVVLTTAAGAVEAGRLWSTAPLPALAAMASPRPPAPVLEAASRLRHRALVLACLVVDRPSWTEYDAHYFPGLDVLPARVSEVKQYRDGDDPPDRTVLCAEVVCWAEDDDPVWTAEPEQLVARVADDLVAQGLPDPAPVEAQLVRLPRVYPVYRPGFEADLAGLEAWAADHPRLLTFGRQGLFVADNTHHALAMGQAAAACLGPPSPSPGTHGGDGTFDHRRWTEARDGFRCHVVED